MTDQETQAEVERILKGSLGESLRTLIRWQQLELLGFTSAERVARRAGAEGIAERAFERVAGEKG